MSDRKNIDFKMSPPKDSYWKVESQWKEFESFSRCNSRRFAIRNKNGQDQIFNTEFHQFGI